MTDYTEPTPLNPDPARVVGEPPFPETIEGFCEWLRWSAARLREAMPKGKPTDPEAALFAAFWTLAKQIARDGYDVYHDGAFIRHTRCTDGTALLAVALEKLAETFDNADLAAECQTLLDDLAPAPEPIDTNDILTLAKDARIEGENP